MNTLVNRLRNDGPDTFFLSIIMGITFMAVFFSASYILYLVVMTVGWWAVFIPFLLVLAYALGRAFIAYTDNR
jgi:hypothetical protein